MSVVAIDIIFPSGKSMVVAIPGVTVTTLRGQRNQQCLIETNMKQYTIGILLEIKLFATDGHCKLKIVPFLPDRLQQSK